MFDEISVSIPGFTIAARTFGKPSSRAILCFHGLLDNAASFDLLVPRLALKDTYFVSFDLPGVGCSSPYPRGVLPNWKNDAVIIIKATKALGLEKFSIIAHSYGSLMAMLMAVTRKHMVERMVFLDILGPKISFTENYLEYLQHNVDDYVNDDIVSPSVFPDRETAIKDRVKSGLISYHGASMLASRGVKKLENGWAWNFDPALRHIGTSLPHEDELLKIYQAIDAPVLLIRAKDGVPYPEDLYQVRARAIRNLSTHTVAGGHHVHLDEPQLVAPLISKFLDSDRN